MPTPPDPGDEPPKTGQGPSGPWSGVLSGDEVVVLVDGGAGTALRPPPVHRKTGGTRDDPPPREPTGDAAADAAATTGGASRVPVVGAPAVAPSSGPPPAPERPPRRSPKPPRDRPEGSFLHRHLRVPGTLGLIVVVLALALGIGFVGAFVWARNDARNIRSTPIPPTIPRRTQTPGDAEVTTTTKPDLSGDTLIQKLGPSVWTVRTFNSAGQPIQGSALLTQSANGQGLLLTSLAVVEASTHQPAPEITVSGGGFNGKAQLWTWDDSHDLALLVVGKTDVPGLPWVPDSASPKAGDKVYALGGDAKLKPGLITSVSPQAIEDNVFVDDALRGGPIVNVKGEVIGVSSAVYTGGGVPTETAFFGVPIRMSCLGVLACTGAFAGPGTPVAEIPPTPSSTVGNTNDTNNKKTTTTEPDTTEPN